MKKIIASLVGAIFLFVGANIYPNSVFAATQCGDISFFDTAGGQLNTATFGISQKFVISPPAGRSFNTASNYIVDVENAGGLGWTDLTIHVTPTIENRKLVFLSGGQGEEVKLNAHRTLVIYGGGHGTGNEICRVSYRASEHPAGCDISFEPGQPGVSQKVVARFRNFTQRILSGKWVDVYPNVTVSPVRQSGGTYGGYEVDISGFSVSGTYRVTFNSGVLGQGVPACSANLVVSDNPGSKQGEVTITRSDASSQQSPISASKVKWCGTNRFGLETALGCIPVGDSNEFVGWFLKWALGIAGGVAFILMLMAGFQIMTAGGNPEKVQGGRELLNAAISGLVLIVFSIFLLKLIGVDILAIPGF